MGKIYNKLVRDNIPELIEADGRTCDITILTSEEFKGSYIAKKKSLTSKEKLARMLGIRKRL